MIDYNIMGPEALFKVNSGQQTNSVSEESTHIPARV